MKWFRSVLAGQIHMRLAYPWGFWTSLIAELFIVGSMNWFLWNAIIDSRGGVGFPGFTTWGLVLYTMITTTLRKVQVNSEQFIGIAEDIYTGSLNKYLVYPVPYFGFRFAMHLGSSLMSLLQSGAALGFFWYFAARHAQPLPTVSAITQFLAMVMVSIGLRFVINSAIQATAFWFEQIWALLVLFSFLIALLGGQLIPLSLYPVWAQEILQYTPFPILAALPAEALLGRLSWLQFSVGMGIGCFWSLIFYGLANFVFRAGVRDYSGIGA
ncbi:MAG: ABC-2 family transporter protein [Chitinophagaceae bacterium]|nr:ABC-2 family transporter protein [Oligoflexus sp.]